MLEAVQVRSWDKATRLQTSDMKPLPAISAALFPSFVAAPGSGSSNVHSQSGYSSSSFASIVGLAFRYPSPRSGLPPGIEPTSFCCLDGFAWLGLEALEVLGNMGVLRGCEMPGEFEEIAEGVVFAVGTAISGGG